jgi:hypothetical protein
VAAKHDRNVRGFSWKTSRLKHIWNVHNVSKSKQLILVTETEANLLTQLKHCEILDFGRNVVESFALLKFQGEQVGSRLPTFRENL